MYVSNFHCSRFKFNFFVLSFLISEWQNRLLEAGMRAFICSLNESRAFKLVQLKISAYPEFNEGNFFSCPSSVFLIEERTKNRKSGTEIIFYKEKKTNRSIFLYLSHRN